MSINHYSSEAPETTTFWWTTSTQQQQQNPPIPNPNPQFCLNSHTPSSSTHRFNLNNNQHEEEVEDDVVEEEEEDQRSQEEGVVVEEQKEAMFEKPLTPSDVGKLNRLVIPKQHAEKYFPLGGSDSGLLLSFEDESGKCWRFRYSYWNSSQSYVLTKGWSRYVKDKRLDAGDVVLFHRHRTHSNRFFITWRRRHPTPPAHVSARPNTNTDGNGNGNGNGSVPLAWTRGFYSAPPYPTHHHPLPYQPDTSLHAGGGSQGQKAGGNSCNSSGSRVLRLFGVNMECQPSQAFTPECSTQQFYLHHRQPSYSSSNPHHHMLHQQPD